MSVCFGGKRLRTAPVGQHRVSQPRSPAERRPPGEAQRPAVLTVDTVTTTWFSVLHLSTLF